VHFFQDQEFSERKVRHLPFYIFQVKKKKKKKMLQLR
jgi:hypothetical protein